MYEKLDESRLLISELKRSGFEINNRYWVYNCGWKFIIIKKKFMKLEDLKREILVIISGFLKLKESDILIED